MLKERLIQYKQDNPRDFVIKDKELLNDLLSFPLDLPIKQKISAIILNYSEAPRCECGASLKWNSKRKPPLKHGTVFGGWNEFCSQQCMRKSSSTVEKRKNTNLNRYGVEHAAQSEEIKEKSKQTCIEKYGVEYSFQSEEIKEKSKQTCIEKYGTEYFSQTDEYLQKRDETILIQTDGKFTNHFQDIEKIKRSNNEKYDVDYFTQTEHGRLSLSKNNAMKNPDTARKSRINRSLNVLNNKTLVNLLIENNVENIKEYLVNTMESNGFQFRQQLANHLQISYSYLNNIMRNYDMRDMYLNYGKGSSFKEKEIYDFVKSLGVNCVNSDRTLLNGLEIDILCPDQKIAIEFNGMKWHSVLGGKDKNYHLNKTEIAEDNGYQLLHIFESEWDDSIKREIWKSIIKSKLGVISNRIHARKCKLIELNSRIARIFFDENHLAGFIPAKSYYGLEFEDKLVSAISIGKSRFAQDENEIYRFVTLRDHTVIGAFGKFMSNLQLHNYVSYADRRYSGINSVYGKFFTKKKKLSPNWYGMEVGVYDIKHRLSFTKHRLIEIIKDYDHSKTTIDNMLNNGYDIIYDCGNWKFYN